ncbi:hypothetical protein J1780_03580 [Rahnella aceris]|uniref:YcgJ family protein n=1 Tax=Rahnella sp. (strain Y9602) TaxID=2703885 RepID=UPI001C2614B8|nr:YcgJ family protein [Rahnella aceris]MBU9839036.1 hypothetical protein [Rahnella aceris]
MNYLILTAALLSGPSVASAAGVFLPSAGVVCDTAGHFCADREGISMGLTTQYLGKSAQETLARAVGKGAEVQLWEYTLSNGVHCDAHERQCYTDRYYPRTAEKYDTRFTQHLYGKKRQGGSTAGN